MIDDPLISCLCVTRHKANLLTRVIRSFHGQTYRNKELLIVYEDDDLSTTQFVEKISDSDIAKLEVPASPKRTLGELRNLSVLECHGEYFCQWDDDDWYHENRLEFQMNTIRESQLPSCVMIQWLVFDATRDRAYISNIRPWEGSLLCKTSVMTDEMRYGETARGEEAGLIDKLLLKNLIATIVRPQLYVYVYHGNNVWDYEHWKNIFAAGEELPAESASIIKGILENKYTTGEGSRLLDQIMSGI